MLMMVNQHVVLGYFQPSLKGLALLSYGRFPARRVGSPTTVSTEKIVGAPRLELETGLPGTRETPQTQLFVAEELSGVDLQDSLGGQPGCQQTDYRHDEHDAGKDDGISRRGLEDDLGEEVAGEHAA